MRSIHEYIVSTFYMNTFEHFNNFSLESWIHVIRHTWFDRRDGMEVQLKADRNR